MTGNWGRWGPDDERGALNLITSDAVLSAAAAIRKGRVISLAQPLDEHMPVADGRAPLSHHMTRDGGDYAAGGKVLGRSRYADDVVSIGTHTGTHIDSLSHLWYGDELYNGHPQNGIRSRGAMRCGAEKLGPIAGRGVLLDVAGQAGVRHLAVQTTIGSKELEAAGGAAGVELAAGDVVLIRTGWLGSSGTGYFGGEPGLDLEGAQWLAEHDVAAVGADNYAVEALGKVATDGFPVHELLLRDHGIPLIENLVLDDLAAVRPGPFLFVAAPLPIRGATASPLSPVAIV